MSDDSTAFERLMYGGFGYGKMCIPAGLGQLILTILFPPAGVFYEEYKTGFKNVSRIVMNFILTTRSLHPKVRHLNREISFLSQVH